MRKALAIFLDDGGVMNDNALRGPQWQKYLGEFLPQHLGSTAKAWAEANRVLITKDVFETFLTRVFGRVDVSFQHYERAYATFWFGEMCRHVSVNPPGDERCVPLLREAYSYVTPRVRAAFPGATEAIQNLHDEGYVLHTASNEASYELEGYLNSMGVRHCFGRLYGVDLVDILKESPEYYRRVLQDAGLDASQALIVDDSARRLSYAAQLGAKTVLIGKNHDLRFDGVIKSLAELPEWLKAKEM